MEENWDETPTFTVKSQPDNGFEGNSEGGRMFCRGRGVAIKPLATENKFNDWTSNGNAKVSDSGWNDVNNDNENGGWGNSESSDFGNRGRGRGRGGRGDGRGGRGDGRGGGRSFNRGDDDDGGSRQYRDSRGGDRGSRGDRGGRGGIRGRGGSSGYSGDGDAWNETANNQEEAPKPREIYIPPEPTTDENEMFCSGITSGINFAKFDEIKVQCTGENVPPAINSFQESGLRQLILENVQKSNYTKPTPIQKYAIPAIINGRDLMACAQTGSGKTAAFLLPIINSLLENAQDLVVDGIHCEPQAVIVSPTRELTIQIYEEARKFSYNSSIKTVVAYGGTSVGYQNRHLLSGCHILVATPGRMNDFVKRGSITFSSVRFVVLDEADRMLDMGFLPNMEDMLDHATMTKTGDRQTLMFSATFPEEIQHLAAKFLNNYIFITVGIVGGACNDVDQEFYQVDKFQKRSKLVEILKSEADSHKTLVFVETKRNADFLATFLSESDLKTTSIHGDRLQREREQALGDFKRGRMKVLVATGVAARGLDIRGVTHVINYDLPKSIEEYVHRIGRTGRVGNRGKATSFYDEAQDSPIAGPLSIILKQVGQDVPEFLNRTGSSSRYETSTFGGHDIRGDTFGDNNIIHSTGGFQEDEEAW